MGWMIGVLFLEVLLLMVFIEVVLSLVLLSVVWLIFDGYCNEILFVIFLVVVYWFGCVYGVECFGFWDFWYLGLGCYCLR